MLAILILLNLLSMLVCYQVAKSRNADRWYWLLAGLLFGPFAIPFVFFAAADRKRTKKR